MTASETPAPPDFDPEKLRAFLADVLKKIPAAAVDDVVIRRETVASPQLDAKVRLFVYLGGGS